MEEYLNKLLSQIRCKKAWPFLDSEIRGHIEDQIEDNLASGMEPEEAEKAAIADMGDPVEVGISLDKIHRPRMSWGIITLVAFLGLISVVLRFTIYNMIIESSADSDKMRMMYRELKMIGIADWIRCLIVMCIVYFIDYTRIAKYARLIGAGIIALGLYGLFFGEMLNGTRYTIMFFGVIRASIASILMLYLPIYGAILYKYRGKGIGGLLAAIAWMIVPLFVVRSLPNLSQTLLMFVCMMIQLTIAVKKKWYKVPVKRTIAALWGVMLVLPIISMIGLYSLHMMKPYQEARVNAFLEGDMNIMNTFRDMNSDIQFLGKSNVDLMSGSFDSNNTVLTGDFSIIVVLHMYGALAGMIVIVALTSLVVYIFSSVLRQKNEVGLVMGCGCGIIILSNMLLNLLIVFGVFPPTASFLPFISTGNSNMMVCYMLVGIVLSIYRYKDIYPRHIRVAQKRTN